jgi:hypothetical protein
MTKLPAVYTSRSDVDPDYLDRFKEWYANKHAPDLIAAGFYSAQVYYSEIGEQLTCNLYEVPGLEIFLTQAYQDVSAKDTQGPEVLSRLKNRSNTIYEQVLTVNVPEVRVDWAHGDRTGAITQPCISTLRFEITEPAEKELLEWYGRLEFPRLQSVAGFKTGRVCRRSGQHPAAPSRDPNWMVLNEWVSLDAAKAGAPAVGVVQRHEAAFRGKISRISFNVGLRGFRLAKSAS